MDVELQVTFVTARIWAHVATSAHPFVSEVSIQRVWRAQTMRDGQMQGQALHSNGSAHMPHTTYGELHEGANSAAQQIVNDFQQARYGPIVSLQQLNGVQSMDT